jgi:hypothetical protein
MKTFSASKTFLFSASVIFCELVKCTNFFFICCTESKNKNILKMINFLVQYFMLKANEHEWFSWKKLSVLMNFPCA